MFCSPLPTVLWAALSVAAAPSPVQPAESAAVTAGEPAPQVPAAGPLQPAPAASPVFALHPSIVLQDVGVDNNIQGTGINPQEDTVGQLWMKVAPSVQSGGLTITGTGSLGLSYFKQHTEQRSVDTKDDFRLDYRFNRVTLYGADAFLRTRDAFGPELDARLPRMQNTFDAGLRVQATGKTQVGAGVRHNRYDFEADQLATADLHSSLTRSEDSVIVSLRNAITPLTTLVVEGDVQRDRFDYATFRDGNGVRVLGGFEFKPTAFISGKSYVGYRTRTSRDGSYSDVSALVASVDLGYTPWDAVKLGVLVNRDLDYSFFTTEQFYIVTGLSGTITVRFADAWEVGGIVGRENLDYGAGSPVDPVTGQPVRDNAPFSERVMHVAGSIGYHVGRSAVIRFSPDYIRRDSEQPLRTYDRLRLVSTISVGFD